MNLLLLLLAQDESIKTADVPTAMGAHTWFIILAFSAFLAWSISYSLHLHKVALARKRGREGLVRQKDELIDRIAALEAQKEAGSISEKRYRQEMKELKFRLAKVVEKLGAKTG